MKYLANDLPVRPQIFVSYRRDDIPKSELEKVIAWLGRHFDKQVFVDERGLEPGAHLTKAIEEAIEASAAVVVLIGPTWHSQQDRKTGRRRLDDPRDFVRREIEIAGKRKVIPILVGENAKIPNEALRSLPTLAFLADLRVIKLAEADSFDSSLCDTLWDRLSRAGLPRSTSAILGRDPILPGFLLEQVAHVTKGFADESPKARYGIVRALRELENVAVQREVEYIPKAAQLIKTARVIWADCGRKTKKLNDDFLKANQICAQSGGHVFRVFFHGDVDDSTYNTILTHVRESRMSPLLFPKGKGIGILHDHGLPTGFGMTLIGKSINEPKRPEPSPKDPISDQLEAVLVHWGPVKTPDRHRGLILRETTWLQHFARLYSQLCIGAEVVKDVTSLYSHFGHYTRARRRQTDELYGNASGQAPA